MTNVVDIVGTIANSFNIGPATLIIDSTTGKLESSIGFGVKNSGYVSNVLLGVKTPLSNSGLTLTLHSGTEMLISNGRDMYDATTNPNGIGLLKSIRLLTSTDYTLTMTALASGVKKEYDIFYNNDSTTLVAYEKEKISSEDEQADVNLYDVWRDVNNNLFYVKSSGSWAVAHMIKVGSVTLNGSSISFIEPAMPIDFVKLNDYVSNIGSGDPKWNWQEIAASSSTTSSITLTGKPCKDVSNLIIMVEGIQLPNSAYTLNSTGYVVTFTEAVPAGLRIVARWL